MEPKNEYDSKVHGVLSKLRFLSKIDKREKLDVASLSLVADTWYNNLYRWTINLAASQGIHWKSPESRNVSLELIQATSDEALKLVKELFSNSSASNDQLNSSLGKMIISTLNEMGPGIEGLKKTYASDRMFISKVEVFQEVLKTRLLELHRAWPSLDESTEFPSLPPTPRMPTASEKNSLSGSDKTSKISRQSIAPPQFRKQFHSDDEDLGGKSEEDL